MTSPPHGCPRHVLGIDTPDGYAHGRGPVTASVGRPSADLLDRALIGWERFTGSRREPGDG
ncbi:hypothetical protein [Streptomyces vinaceus]|uniref:hypothetical protein n=1 Tax=Streptomyces vinaceus TaxID=1960 RepID=UPI0036CCE94E